MNIYIYLVTIHKFTLTNLPLMLYYHVYYHQKTKCYKHLSTTGLNMLKNARFARVQLLQKGIIGKIILKVNARKGRQKMSKILLVLYWHLLSSQIKSDDVLPDFTWKPIKVLKRSKELLLNVYWLSAYYRLVSFMKDKLGMMKWNFSWPSSAITSHKLWSQMW